MLADSFYQHLSKWHGLGYHKWQLTCSKCRVKCFKGNLVGNQSVLFWKDFRKSWINTFHRSTVERKSLLGCFWWVFEAGCPSLFTLVKWSLLRCLTDWSCWGKNQKLCKSWHSLFLYDLEFVPASNLPSSETDNVFPPEINEQLEQLAFV